MNFEVIMTIALIMCLRGDWAYRGEQFVKEKYEAVKDKLSGAQQKLYEYFATNYDGIHAEFIAVVKRSLTDDALQEIIDVLVPSKAFQTENINNFETLKKYLERRIHTTPQIAGITKSIKDIFKSYYQDYKELNVDKTEEKYDAATYEVALLEFFVTQMVNKLVELSRSTTEEDAKQYKSIKSSLRTVLNNIETHWPETKSLGRTTARNHLIKGVTKNVEHLIRYCDHERRNLSLEDYLRDADSKAYSLQEDFSNFMLRASNGSLLESLDKRTIHLCSLAKGKLALRYWPGSWGGSWQTKSINTYAPISDLVRFYARHAQLQSVATQGQIAAVYPRAVGHEHRANKDLAHSLKYYAPRLDNSAHMGEVYEDTTRIFGGIYLLRVLTNDLRASLAGQGEDTLMKSGQAQFQCQLIKSLLQYVEGKVMHLTGDTEYFKELRERLHPRKMKTKPLSVALTDTKLKDVEQRASWQSNGEYKSVPQASNIAVSHWWIQVRESIEAVKPEHEKILEYIGERAHEYKQALSGELTTFDVNLAINLLHNPELNEFLQPHLLRNNKDNLVGFIEKLRALDILFFQTRAPLTRVGASCLADELRRTDYQWHFLRKEQDGIFLQFDKIRCHTDFIVLKKELSLVIQALAKMRTSPKLQKAIEAHQTLEKAVDEIISQPAVFAGTEFMRAAPYLSDSDDVSSVSSASSVSDVEMKPLLKVDGVKLNLFQHVYKSLYDTSGWFKWSFWLQSPLLFTKLTMQRLADYCSTKPFSRSQQARQVVINLLQQITDQQEHFLMQQGRYSDLKDENKAKIFHAVHRTAYNNSLFGRTHLKQDANFDEIKKHAEDKGHSRSYAIYNAFGFGAPAA